MKRMLTAVLCVLLALCLISSATAFAESAPAAEPEQVVDVAEADDAVLDDSFVMTSDGEPVLEVVHVKAPGLTAALSGVASTGYYTAEFMIPESNYKVFLTGLTQENIEEIRQAIIDSYADGAGFHLKNLGFIDTEKTWDEDGDDNLCWAAASSNLLTYTGWAAKAGFHSADDLFEAFIGAFSNEGGNVMYATGWFLNGVAASNGAQPAAGTGRFLPQYNYNDVAEVFDIHENCAEQLTTVYDRLTDGWGVSLSTNIYGQNGYEGGHSVSCWGFVTDTRYPKSSRQFFKDVFITDSDSDKYSVQNGKDRREADDVMSLCALTPVQQEGIDTYQFNISDRQVAVLSEAVTILPYSDRVPYETSSDATMDMLTSPDIVIDPFILTDDTDSDKTKTIFAPGTTIYYCPYMMNISNAPYNGTLSLTVTVDDEEGNAVYTKDFYYPYATEIKPTYGMAFGLTAVTQQLPVGDYTVTASFNPNHDVTEAYFFNNTKSVAFKIRDQYRIGDADNSGSVTSADTTIIQRILARFDVDIDENVTQRADVNENGEIDLTDVTVIQRHLARMDVNFSVNELKFYL